MIFYTHIRVDRIYKNSTSLVKGDFYVKRKDTLYIHPRLFQRMQRYVDDTTTITTITRFVQRRGQSAAESSIILGRRISGFLECCRSGWRPCSDIFRRSCRFWWLYSGSAARLGSWRARRTCADRRRCTAASPDVCWRLCACAVVSGCAASAASKSSRMVFSDWSPSRRCASLATSKARPPESPWWCDVGNATTKQPSRTRRTMDRLWDPEPAASTREITSENKYGKNVFKEPHHWR